VDLATRDLAAGFTPVQVAGLTRDLVAGLTPVQVAGLTRDLAVALIPAPVAEPTQVRVVERPRVQVAERTQDPAAALTVGQGGLVSMDPAAEILIHGTAPLPTVVDANRHDYILYSSAFGFACQGRVTLSLEIQSNNTELFLFIAVFVPAYCSPKKPMFQFSHVVDSIVLR